MAGREPILSKKINLETDFFRLGHKSSQHIFPHCLGCFFGTLTSFQVVFCSIWHPVILAIVDPKTPIFGPTWTWNDTWMGHKSVQHIYSHCLGCVLAHYPVSRWVIGLIWQPTIMVYFDPKKWAFLDAPWPGMGPGEGLNGLKPPSCIYV